MSRWQLLQVEVTSAAPDELITGLHRANVSIYDAIIVNEMTVRFSVEKQDYPHVEKLLNKRGEEIHAVRKQGAWWRIHTILNRPVFVVCLLIFFLLTLFLPSRILFVKVTGNIHVTQETILTALEACGVGFGASRRAIRSERVKNYLLEEIPLLQWAGVNTRGCVAEIAVQERVVAQRAEQPTGLQCIVAARDGIIRQMTVTGGNGLCTVGQAVTKGQLLVSSYTDCGNLIKTEPAQAEIYADTKHDLTLICPVEYRERKGKVRIEKKYGLLIGKKLINFFKDSGISDTSCVKMYDEYRWELAEGFALPVSLIRYTIVYYETQVTGEDSPEEFSWVSELAEQYLLQQMNAGSIYEADTGDSFENGTYRYDGKFACYEMIGQACSEEIFTGYGKRD